MPRPLPPSLGESFPDPSEGSGNPTPPSGRPEEILRVLGGTGLPGDTVIGRIAEDEPEPLVVPFGDEEEVVPIIYDASEGLNIAEVRRTWSDGAAKALDILKQTERSPETDTLYDDVILTQAQTRVGWSDGAAKALDYLDRHRPRTLEAQAAANAFYDEVILNHARTRRSWSDGSNKALDYLDTHTTRTESAKTECDVLYDEIIISEATVRRGWSSGKSKALAYINGHTPKTAQGAQAIQDLRQEIEDS